MRKKLLSASLSIIIVVLLLVGCGSSDSSGGTMASGSWTPGQTSIKLLGASWYAENGYIHVFYSIEATNKSSRTFDGSSFNITCLDEEGRGLDFSSGYIVPIAPGDTIRFSNSLKYFGRAPTSVDLRFMDNIGMYSDDYVPYQSAFPISNISTSSSNDFYTVSGTVTNNSTEEQGIMVSAIFAQKVRLSVDISLMQIHCTQVNPSYFIFLHHELLRDATYMQLQQMHINIFLGSLLRILF